MCGVSCVVFFFFSTVARERNLAFVDVFFLWGPWPKKGKAVFFFFWVKKGKRKKRKEGTNGSRLALRYAVEDCRERRAAILQLLVLAVAAPLFKLCSHCNFFFCCNVC